MKKSDAIAITGVRNDREPALLECEGNPSCGRWVRHVFVGELQASSALSVGRWSVPLELCFSDTSHAEIYACRQCGARRVFGLIDTSKKPQ